MAQWMAVHYPDGRDPLWRSLEAWADQRRARAASARCGGRRVSGRLDPKDRLTPVRVVAQLAPDVAV
jgi:hypothetical protein